MNFIDEKDKKLRKKRKETELQQTSIVKKKMDETKMKINEGKGNSLTNKERKKKDERWKGQKMRKKKKKNGKTDEKDEKKQNKQGVTE